MPCIQNSGMGHFDVDTHFRNPETATGKPALKRPRMYRVVMLNDDFTPMDFVVDILIRYFQKSPAEATSLMLRVHTKGSAVCGVYPREIAESKLALVEGTSREHGHPLRCVMEPEPEE